MNKQATAPVRPAYTIESGSSIVPYSFKKKKAVPPVEEKEEDLEKVAAAVPRPEDFPDLMAKYDNTPDPSHGIPHINAVRSTAAMLADKYAPAQKPLIDLAAALHDIERDNPQGEDLHHALGAATVMEHPGLRAALRPRQLSQLTAMILNHRSSTGNPTTVPEKIISDADRTGGTEDYPLQRPYLYRSHGKAVDSDTHMNYIVEAASHIARKYGPGGKGTRTYFPETADWITKTYSPVIEAYNNKDMAAMEKLTGPKELLLKTAATPPPSAVDTEAIWSHFDDMGIHSNKGLDLVKASYPDLDKFDPRINQFINNYGEETIRAALSRTNPWLSKKAKYELDTRPHTTGHGTVSLTPAGEKYLPKPPPKPVYNVPLPQGMSTDDVPPINRNPDVNSKPSPVEDIAPEDPFKREMYLKEQQAKKNKAAADAAKASGEAPDTSGVYIGEEAKRQRQMQRGVVPVPAALLATPPPAAAQQAGPAPAQSSSSVPQASPVAPAPATNAAPAQQPAKPPIVFNQSTAKKPPVPIPLKPLVPLPGTAPKYDEPEPAKPAAPVVPAVPSTLPKAVPNIDKGGNKSFTSSRGASPAINTTPSMTKTATGHTTAAGNFGNLMTSNPSEVQYGKGISEPIKSAPPKAPSAPATAPQKDPAGMLPANAPRQIGKPGMQPEKQYLERQKQQEARIGRSWNAVGNAVGAVADNPVTRAIPQTSEDIGFNSVARGWSNLGSSILRAPSVATRTLGWDKPSSAIMGGLGNVANETAGTWAGWGDKLQGARDAVVPAPKYNTDMVDDYFNGNYQQLAARGLKEGLEFAPAVATGKVWGSALKGASAAQKAAAVADFGTLAGEAAVGAKYTAHGLSAASEPNLWRGSGPVGSMIQRNLSGLGQAMPDKAKDIMGRAAAVPISAGETVPLTGARILERSFPGMWDKGGEYAGKNLLPFLGGQTGVNNTAARGAAVTEDQLAAYINSQSQAVAPSVDDAAVATLQPSMPNVTGLAVAGQKHLQLADNPITNAITGGFDRLVGPEQFNTMVKGFSRGVSQTPANRQAAANVKLPSRRAVTSEAINTATNWINRNNIMPQGTSVQIGSRTLGNPSMPAVTPY